MLLGAMKGNLYCICKAINVWVRKVVTSTSCPHDRREQDVHTADVNEMSTRQMWTIFKTANRNKEVGLHYTATFVPPELFSKE